MIKIKIKSQTVEVVDLNEDCNYEINKYHLIHSLSYVQWSHKELMLLDAGNMINWDIYSENDLTCETIGHFYKKINLSGYLDFMESKYKTIPAKMIDNLELLYDVDNFKSIIRTSVQKAPNFYYTSSDFLKSFKFAIDTYNSDIVLRYINTTDLLAYFVKLLPLTLIKLLLFKMVIPADDLINIFNSVLEINNNNIYPEVLYAFFQTQTFSFDFIISRTWTYDTWIVILKHMSFSDEQIIFMSNNVKYGNTLKILISKYLTLSNEFISSNIGLLDMNLISEYQPLSYEFVKAHISSVNMIKLKKNNNIKFAVYEIISENEILNAPRYVIQKNNNFNDDVIFID